MIYVVVTDRPSGRKQFHADFNGSARFTAKCDAERRQKQVPNSTLMTFRNMREAGEWSLQFEPK